MAGKKSTPKKKSEVGEDPEILDEGEEVELEDVDLDDLELEDGDDEDDEKA